MNEDGPATPTVDLTEKTLQARVGAKLEQTRAQSQQAAQEQIQMISQVAQEQIQMISEAAQEQSRLMIEQMMTRHAALETKWMKSLTDGQRTTSSVTRTENQALERQARQIGTLAKRLAWYPIIIGLIIGLLLTGWGIWARVTLPTSFPPATVPTQVVIQGGSTYETIKEKGWTICKKTGQPCKKLKEN